MRYLVYLCFLLSACQTTPPWYVQYDIHSFVKPLEPFPEDIASLHWWSLDKWHQVLVKQPIEAYVQPRTILTLEYANTHYNRYKGQYDFVTYKTTDYWPTPKQFELKGEGDCKASSIAKYYFLRKHGFKATDLALWTGWYKSANTDHMVLVAKVNGTEWVLDNMSNNLIEAKDYFYKQFYPVVSFNELGWGNR